VHVPHAHAHLLQVVRQILGHALRERRDEHALAASLANADLVEQIVDLTAHGPHLDLRVEETRGRMICSTTTPSDSCSSSSAGVALTISARGVSARNSSNTSGRLSSALGRRNRSRRA
jgi:hypothetical protein